MWVKKTSKEHNLKTDSFNSSFNSRKNNKNNYGFNSSTFERDVKFPLRIYSIKQLLQLSHDCVCCSTCGMDEFVDKRYASDWFGSYHVDYSYAKQKTPFHREGQTVKSTPKTGATPNKRKPDLRWVPKSA